MKILIIEDNKDISNILKKYLKREKYDIDQAFTGEEGLELFVENYYDLIILDLMLPIVSGEEILETIRKTSFIPIIILSAKTNQNSKLHGLENGADDYVSKPFSAKEIVVRVNTLLRRAKEYKYFDDSSTYDDGVLKINLEKMEVVYNNQIIGLTANEFKVLQVLIKNKGVVLSREQIIEKVFNNEFEGYDRAIDTYIKNIRSKINKEYITTIYSMGYKFVEKDQL